MKIFKILLILALGLQIGFAEGESGNNQQEQNINQYLPNDDYNIKGQTCSWKCRSVGDGYTTKITNYDFRHGITECDILIYGTNQKVIGYNANQRNEACSAAKNINDDSAFAEYYALITDKKKGSQGSSIKYDNKQEKIRMSQFIVGLVTLDPNIIDRKNTTRDGEIALKKPLYSITEIVRTGWDNVTLTNDVNWRNFKTDLGNLLTSTTNTVLSRQGIDAMPLSNETISTIDSFNKNNMAYFNDLFSANSTIYQHLQVFIFILVGGFFVMTIGVSKIQAYLENRGESEGKQPYLHKFYIPLLMVGVFFMPIPEGNGYHSTVMQNMIRYFAQYSTTIADMAHSVGAKTYMDKIYKRVGGFNNEKLALMALEEQLDKHFITQSYNAFQKKCKNRYGDLIANTNINNANENLVVEKTILKFKERTGLLPNEVTGKLTDDIAFETCVNLEIKYRQSQTKFQDTIATKEAFSKYKDNYEQILNQADKYFALRNNQLGWIDSILTPTASIAIETIMLAEILGTKAQIRDKQNETIKKGRDARTRAVNDNNTNSLAGEANESKMGWLAGKLVWMMMPGATSIKDFIVGAYNSVATTIVDGIKSADVPVVSKAIGFGVGVILDFIKTLGVVPAAYFIATWLIEKTYDMIPLLVISTSCLVAFISYLVSLCKYFYISPFVTAWAMATKRIDKIIDFLLTGISIFFRPVLIILFINLALFLHTLIEDFFVFVSFEQFASIKTGFWDFHTNFVLGAISGLIKIFGMLAQGYISWKLIVSGPSWVLSLIGLDGKHDDMIAQGLETNMARRAFVA